MLEVALRVTTIHDDVERLDSIPGIAARMAEQILAEIGMAGEDEGCLEEDREFQGETDDAYGEAWHVPNAD
ncbi:hypothetical protein GC102_36775 [Paenibacillus sp. LMG 31460]|uniref:Uncharacterized protein n=1 Tax=Paenibacillus germinis TaxID=2654979 RepID=A0ABX1ZDV5_9BACL|nr:hypothetical protein [Paenibacillus germinis]